MESEQTDERSKREYIQRILYSRGRQVDLHGYLLKHPDELLKGVLVAGAIGSGKTERAISIVCSALDLDYGVLIFDPSNDYQRLLRRYQDGVVIDFKEFYMNPLESPPGLSLEEWSSIFIQVFAHNFGLKDPSIAILQNSMNNLLKSSRERPPTLSELLEEVAQFQPRSRSSEISSHASVQNRLESVLASEWKRCLDVRHGFTPTDFEEGLLIVKLRPVGIERVHEFVVGITVAKLFAYRSWKQNLGESLGKNVLVVIEEAHRFLSEGRQGDRNGQTLYLERALVESRKLGVGFVVVDQMPHRISDYVLGSCSLWVVCRLMDPNSRRMVGEALRMDVVWSHLGLMELPVGGAIIRVENQHELEESSPLAYRDEKYLYDVTGLPATVALPANPECLIPSMGSKDVWDRMLKNERYIRYFERVLMQDYGRIEETLQESEKPELRGFIARTLGKETEDSEIHGISKQSEIPRPMDKHQIDECRRLVGVLSSRTQVVLLESLLKSIKVNLQQLAESVSRSPSWISRTMGELVATGVVQKQSSVYSLSPKGRDLLRWGFSLCHDIEKQDSEPSFVDMNLDELRLLLSRITEYWELKENATIAGQRGTQENREGILRLAYLFRFIIERDKIDSNAPREINVEVFRLLKTSLEGNILSSLLTNNRPILLSQISRDAKVSERSIRRQLALLEKHRIIEKLRHSGRKGVRLSAAWRTLLKHLVLESKNRVAVPAALLKRILRMARDSILYVYLLRGEKMIEDWEKYRMILAKIRLDEQG